MRVSFFNELDSFCLDNKIDSKEVIEGMCLDSRIGSFYNNPSFGFGGLCLPKDSLQLLYRFKNSPNDLLTAIQNSNQSRAEHLVSHILSKKPKIVGVYNLAMKAKSDNSRNASIYNLIYGLLEKNIKIIIYDKSIQSLDRKGLKLIDDFKSFVETSDLILANRIDNKILPFRNKIFSRDIFSSD
jgi:UDPglucose 6-dehydrogenase